MPTNTCVKWSTTVAWSLSADKCQIKPSANDWLHSFLFFNGGSRGGSRAGKVRCCVLILWQAQTIWKIGPKIKP